MKKKRKKTSNASSRVAIDLGILNEHERTDRSVLICIVELKNEKTGLVRIIKHYTPKKKLPMILEKKAPDGWIVTNTHIVVSLKEYTALTRKEDTEVKIREDKCSVCWDAEVMVLSSPCMHRCMCVECYHKIKQTEHAYRCIVCRAVISHYFLPDGSIQE